MGCSAVKERYLKGKLAQLKSEFAESQKGIDRCESEVEEVLKHQVGGDASRAEPWIAKMDKLKQNHYRLRDRIEVGFVHSFLFLFRFWLDLGTLWGRSGIASGSFLGSSWA